MSAIAAVIKEHGVHLLADGAFYNPNTGVITGLECKVRKVPGIEAAYSSRGAAMAFPIFEAICENSQFRKFDELVAVLPALLDLHDSYLRLFGKEGSEIVVAGWSESRNQAEVYARQSHSDSVPLKRGECYKWTEGRVSFGIDWEHLPEPEAFQATGAVEAFQRARETLNDLHCGESEEPHMGYAVGGGIYHCVVGALGASEIRQIHSWPDEVGQKIEPHNGLTWVSGQEAIDFALARQGLESSEGRIDHEPLGTVQIAA